MAQEALERRQGDTFLNGSDAEGMPKHMRGHGPWAWLRSSTLSDYEIRAAPMRGWRCSAAIGAGLDGVVDFIGANARPGESLFVFPDATVIYGLTGRESYRNAPFIFHLRQVPPEGELKDRFTGELARRPPDWVVIHTHSEAWFCYTADLMAWLGLDTMLAERYRAVWRRGQFEIFRRER